MSQICTDLSSVKVNIRVGRIGLQGILEVLEAEQRIFFRVRAQLDVEGSSLDECIRPKTKHFNLKYLQWPLFVRFNLMFNVRTVVDKN